MKIDLTKTYKTKQGHEVRLYAVDGKGPYSVHGAIKLGSEFVCESWTSDGEHSTCNGSSHLNLVEVAKKVTLYGYYVSHDDCYLYLSKSNRDTRVKHLTRAFSSRKKVYKFEHIIELKE